MATDHGRALARSSLVPAGPALAVPPFADLGRDPRQRHFATGIRSQDPNEISNVESTARETMPRVQSCVDGGLSKAAR